jgi:hypothetical protein
MYLLHIVCKLQQILSMGIAKRMNSEKAKKRTQLSVHALIILQAKQRKSRSQACSTTPKEEESGI